MSDLTTNLRGIVAEALESGYTLDGFVQLLADASSPITLLVNQILEEFADESTDIFGELESVIASFMDKQMDNRDVEALHQFFNGFNWATDKQDCGNPFITLKAMFNTDLANATLEQLYEVAVLASYKDDANRKKRLNTSQIMELLNLVAPAGMPTKKKEQKAWLTSFIANFGALKGDASWDTTEKLNKRMLPTAAFYGEDHIQKVCSWESKVLGG